MKSLFLAAALAAIALPLPAAARPEPAQAAAEIRMDHVTIVKVGEGKPLVLVPGLSSPRAVFDSILPRLASTHTVYLVEVNGFSGGAPGANLEPGAIDGMVSDIHRKLASDEAGKALFIGHSLGGLAALKFAKAHPDQVERLMIVDALPYFPAIMSPGGEPPSPAAIEPMARSLKDRIAARHGKPVDLEALKSETARLAIRPESKEQVLRWAAAADPRVTAQFLYEDMITDMRPALGGIAAPITLLYPWSEAVGGKEQALAFYRRQYAGATDVRFVGVGEAAHFLMLDQPEAFADAVLEFTADPAN